MVRIIRKIRPKYLIDNHHHTSRKESMQYGNTKSPSPVSLPRKHTGPLRGGVSGCDFSELLRVQPVESPEHGTTGFYPSSTEGQHSQGNQLRQSFGSTC